MVRRPRPGCSDALPAVAASAMLALALAGCDRQRDGGPPQPGDVAAARVGGETVWAGDVQRLAVADGLIGEGEPFGPAADGFGRVLEAAVDRKLLAREAMRRALDDDPLVRRRLEAAREQVLADALTETEVAKAVGKADVERLYAEYRREQGPVEQVRARQVLLTTQAEAEAVRAAIAGGASFEALTLERSIDPATRFNGGDLGWLEPGVMPAALAAVLRPAAPGSLLGPVRVEGGWAVLRVEERRREPVRALAEMRPQIVRFLSFDRVRTLLATLRTETRVERLAGTPAAAREPASAPGARTIGGELP